MRRRLQIVIIIEKLIRLFLANYLVDRSATASRVVSVNLGCWSATLKENSHHFTVA
jgi:hypothetical protein